MDSNEPGTEILSEPVCWERLRKSSVGRLAVHHDGHPAIYPVNYLVDGKSVVFRTRPGSKIADAPMLERVAFEIDGFEPRHGDAWSVLVKGYARFIDGVPELEATEELPLFPWVLGDKSAWVRIVPIEVTGRRFELVQGTVTDASVGWTDQAEPGPRSSAV